LARPESKEIIPVNTREDIAEIAGVSHGTLDKVREILDKATSEQRAALDRDDASISEIYNEITKGKPVWIGIGDLVASSDLAHVPLEQEKLLTKWSKPIGCILCFSACASET